MMFGVPTMYSRIAREAENDRDLAHAFAGARLLVSGSAALPTSVHERMHAPHGQEILERYGLTETLMNAGVRLGDAVIPGRIGPPLPGVELELRDEDGATIDSSDDETIGEVAVRGPNVFLGYLNRPDATEEAMRDGWFMTGDMATRDESGSLKLVGRKSTDLIKSGGYRIGAGEIEGALLEHPAVAEVAVTGQARTTTSASGSSRGSCPSPAKRDRRGADRSRGHPAHQAQAPARGPLPRRAAAQRDGEGHEARARGPGRRRGVPNPIGNAPQNQTQDPSPPSPTRGNDCGELAVPVIGPGGYGRYRA